MIQVPVVRSSHWLCSSLLPISVHRCTVSIRDILTWVQFINTCSKTVESEVAMETEEQMCSKLDPAVAYIHGACLVFLDGLGAGDNLLRLCDQVVF